VGYHFVSAVGQPTSNRYHTRTMGSKYQEFSDDIVCAGSETTDDRRDAVAVDATSTAAAVPYNIQPSTSVAVSPSTQPVIIVQAPKLQRSFERYPSKAAVVFGGIQVLSVVMTRDRPLLVCFYASDRPGQLSGFIMFSTCPFVLLSVRPLPNCM